MSEALDVLHFKSGEMTFSQGYIHSGGHFSAARLITAANSETLSSGVTTYDGCSIDYTMAADEVFVVLGGNVRILWGLDFSRAVEAQHGDVVWLPKGARVKYQGEKGSILYTTNYVSILRGNTDTGSTREDVPSDVRLFKGQDMQFQEIENAGGPARRSRILTEDISKTLGASIHVYDGCSLEWTPHYDQVSVVLDGTLRLGVGENYDRTIVAKFGDVIRVPNGTPIRYEGENAKVFTALYPIDWQTRHA